MGRRFAPRREKREHHHGIAKPHVVGQAAAESEMLEEQQPAESFALIPAQRAGECGRRVGGLNAVK